MKMPYFQRIASAARGAAWLVRPSGLRSQLAELTRQDGLARDHQLSETARLERENQELRAQIARLQDRDRRIREFDAGDLRSFERRVSSQNGEDGIIEEIFRRIGTTNKFFVEIGAETGEECNCRRLVREAGWNGVFVEADPAKHARLTEVYRDYPEVVCVQAFVRSDQIAQLLADRGVPPDLDLLSIDIDGNDYWVWKAITNRPRVVVIEYNADYRVPRRWVMQENPGHAWDGTNYYGASLASLASLGREKGYTLVCTDSTGVNAFFIRDDLYTTDKFLDPIVHYYYLPLNNRHCPQGHPPRNGPCVEI